VGVEVAVGAGEGDGAGVLAGNGVAGAQEARVASRRKAMKNFRICLFCHKIAAASFEYQSHEQKKIFDFSIVRVHLKFKPFCREDSRQIWSFRMTWT
jgi:hypothetical protein